MTWNGGRPTAKSGQAMARYIEAAVRLIVPFMDSTIRELLEIEAFRSAGGTPTVEKIQPTQIAQTRARMRLTYSFY